MSKNNWEYWIQLSSTIAVLIGVILVVLQLRQNAELLELQILKQETDSYIQNLTELLPESFTETFQKAVDSPELLSRREITELDMFYWSRAIARWRNTYDLAERGLLDQSEWRRSVAEDASGIFANPFGRAYWDSIKEWNTTLPDDLVEAIDNALAESSPNESALIVDELEERLGIDRTEN